MVNLLLPAYEILGKVMFSQASVILSMGRASFPQCHGAGRSPTTKRQTPGQRTDGQQVDGTHPTGMHTCLIPKLAIVVLGVHYEPLNSN